jgi:hypothetical protein
VPASSITAAHPGRHFKSSVSARIDRVLHKFCAELPSLLHLVWIFLFSIEHLPHHTPPPSITSPLFHTSFASSPPPGRLVACLKYLGVLLWRVLPLYAGRLGRITLESCYIKTRPSGCSRTHACPPFPHVRYPLPSFPASRSAPPSIQWSSIFPILIPILSTPVNCCN